MKRSPRSIFLFIICGTFCAFPQNQEIEKLTFSHTRGFYRDNCILTLSSDTPDLEIRYTLDGTTPLTFPSAVKMQIFNLMEQLVDTLIDGKPDVGRHAVIWNGSGQASGVYFYRLTVAEFCQSHKFTLIR